MDCHRQHKIHCCSVLGILGVYPYAKFCMLNVLTYNTVLVKELSVIYFKRSPLLTVAEA